MQHDPINAAQPYSSLRNDLGPSPESFFAPVGRAADMFLSRYIESFADNIPEPINILQASYS